MGCFWDYLNTSCWCFFQFFDNQNEKYQFLLETVKSEKVSPQTIPVAWKVFFLRQEMLLQTSINALHVLSSWEPADLSLDIVHFSEHVQLFQAFQLTRKQLKLYIFMIVFHMSWQWVSISLSRSAIHPDPLFFCPLIVFTLHQMLSCYI